MNKEMQPVLESAKSVISDYDYIINSSSTFAGDNFPIPRFKKSIISEVFELGIASLRKTPVLVRIHGDVVIVGDIHGNIKDLLRILRKNGHPSKTKYLFMGDYVDRGDFSIEVLTLLISLQILYPYNVTMIRGNHETLKISSMYGFKEEACQKYDEDIFNQANTFFEYLPLAALVDNSYLCVHGGICPDLLLISDIERIPKPLCENSVPMQFCQTVEGLLWSDPSMEVHYFDRSTRGRGFEFGPEALSLFLKTNNLKGLIRGHSCTENGVEFAMENTCITVFSSGFYQTGIPNMPGFIKFVDGEPNGHCLTALPQLHRDNVEYHRHIGTQFLRDLNCVRHVKSYQEHTFTNRSRHSMCIFNMYIKSEPPAKQKRSTSASCLSNL